MDAFSMLANTAASVIGGKPGAAPGPDGGRDVGKSASLEIDLDGLLISVFCYFLHINTNVCYI